MRHDEKYYMESTDRRTSEEKWSTIINELQNVLSMSEKICAYCNLYKHPYCPLQTVCDACGGDGQEYRNFKESMNRAIRLAGYIHQAIVDDLEQRPIYSLEKNK